ncbi:MAG: hypothetical protein JO366_15690 [Methylobacteriaceae bacterium]|nr:hypothetical protein [Methylobacteriaceae bacterium]
MRSCRTALLLARASLWLLLLLSLQAGALAAGDPPADELAVAVANNSRPELCTEKDNIDLELSSPEVRSFQIQAVHPAYIGTIVADRRQPDFTSCDMSQDPAYFANAKRVTFWETPDFWLIGYTFPSFWRPNTVPFRVGNRVEHGLDLVQFWMRYQERGEEVLVVYPPDGDWRARPLPPPHLRWTAYGASFLVGPVEMQGRPIVALKEIAFDPDTHMFTMTFARGGSATLRIATIDQDRMVIEAALSGDLPPGLPFAALRSMYTTEFNADIARLAWRTKDGAGWGEAPVMMFPGGPVTELWAGRTLPSRHNLSAPDMAFSLFSAAVPRR